MQQRQSFIKLNFSKFYDTKGERKCHDFLPSFSPRRPFGVQNGLADFLLSFFGCRPKWRAKKVARLFAVLLVTFWCPKLKKGRQKVMRPFLSSKRMPKRHQKVAELILSSNWLATFFGRQKVVHAKRTAKSRGTCIQLKQKGLRFGIETRNFWMAVEQSYPISKRFWELTVREQF